MMTLYQMLSENSSLSKTYWWS